MKKIIRLNDRIWFGKYKGVRVKDIIEYDSDFIKSLKENYMLDEKIWDTSKSNLYIYHYDIEYVNNGRFIYSSHSTVNLIDWF